MISKGRIFFLNVGFDSFFRPLIMFSNIFFVLLQADLNIISGETGEKSPCQTKSEIALP